MPKKQTQNTAVEMAKRRLGKMISKCRGEMSQRALAKSVGLHPSNMKYIEDGVNAPTADIYTAIIQNLKTDKKTHDKMDELYSIIRGTPPPDICDIICRNKGMNDVLRIVKDQELSVQQMAALEALLTSFKTGTQKGEK